MAEAKVILEKGKSTAEGYKLHVEAMGEQNFGMVKVIENLAANDVKLIPDNLVISGGSGGTNLLDSFLGLGILKHVTGKDFTELTSTQAAEETSTTKLIEKK